MDDKKRTTTELQTTLPQPATRQTATSREHQSHSANSNGMLETVEPCEDAVVLGYN